MYEICDICKRTIYPNGVTFTGPCCWYGGKHPVQNHNTGDTGYSDLVVAIRELTAAIVATRSDTPEKEVEV